MKQVDSMPTEGQFVAMWENENGIWCESNVWDSGKLLTADMDGIWEDSSPGTYSLYKSGAIKFFIYGE